VRGRRKLVVAALLVGAATSTGALVGFAVGVAWALARLPVLPRGLVLGLVAVALIADEVFRRAGRPRPWAVGRQVPQDWSRYFSPPTVAVLYGGRLGIGPATILRSWLWWATLVIAASAGVWASTAAGAVFGAVRTLLMVGLAEWVRHAAAPRMGRVRAAEVPALRVLVPTALVVAAYLGA
jgi:hypothetical protein